MLAPEANLQPRQSDAHAPRPDISSLSTWISSARSASWLSVAVCSANAMRPSSPKLVGTRPKAKRLMADELSLSKPRSPNASIENFAPSSLGGFKPPQKAAAPHSKFMKPGVAKSLTRSAPRTGRSHAKAEVLCAPHRQEDRRHRSQASIYPKMTCTDPG